MFFTRLLAALISVLYNVAAATPAADIIEDTIPTIALPCSTAVASTAFNSEMTDFLVARSPYATKLVSILPPHADFGPVLVFKADNALEYGIKKLFWLLGQDVNDEVLRIIANYVTGTPSVVMAEQSMDCQHSTELSYDLMCPDTDLLSSPRIIPAKASWTHFPMLFWSTLFIIIVLALAIKCLLPLIRKGFNKSHAMKDTTDGNSESIEAVEEAVETMEQNRPLQPPLEITPSDLIPEHDSESVYITLEVSGGSELLIPPEEVVKIESAEQGTHSLELIKEKAIYDWKITEFVETFTTLMDFFVDSLEPPNKGFNGKLDFIRANKPNMKKLASALAYVREIGTLVRQGVGVMSARSPHPVSKYFIEMWKPLEEVEAAFFHDRDFKELMDYIEYIDKVQAEDGFKGRKFHKQHRPMVQYTFKVITKMLEEKQANTDKFLDEARKICDRYQTGRDWDTMMELPWESSSWSSSEFAGTIEFVNE